MATSVKFWVAGNSVTLREVNKERYVTLPAGTMVRPSFSVDGRPYVKLSRE